MMNSDGKSTCFMPEILDEESPNAIRRLRQLREDKSIAVIDDLASEQKELYIIEHPTSLFAPAARHSQKLKKGLWIYFPWRSCIVHTLNREAFEKTRISRNFNLILRSEQKKFEKLRIGIAGLNVGNPAALCLALEGGGTKMKFADPDMLTLSNLNRFRAGIPDLGLNKAVLSARQIYEINPFSSIEVWDKGLDEYTLEQFLAKPPLDILIEEMDNVKLKILIRECARKKRIPVLMVTGNGENVIVDVERYDLNPELPLLNGYLKSHVYKKIVGSHELGGKEKVMVSRDFMGQKFLVKRLRTSFLEIGTKLAGIPQLAESSFLRGAALCFFVRQIGIGARVPSGRYFLNLDSLLKNKKSIV